MKALTKALLIVSVYFAVALMSKYNDIYSIYNKGGPHIDIEHFACMIYVLLSICMVLIAGEVEISKEDKCVLEG